MVLSFVHMFVLVNAFLGNEALSFVLPMFSKERPQICNQLARKIKMKRPLISTLWSDDGVGGDDVLAAS